MSRGGDQIRGDRAFAALFADVEAIKAGLQTLGVVIAGDPLSEPLPNAQVLKGYSSTMLAEGAIIPADTDGLHSFGETLTMPSDVLPAGSRLQVDFCFRATPQTFPWSFQLELASGASLIPVAAEEIIDPTPTPTADGMIANVRFVGNVRDDGGGGIVIVPDSLCVWRFPGGTTNRTSDTIANTIFTGLPAFSVAAMLPLEPKILIAGATAGDTIQLLAFTATAWTIPPPSF